MKSIILSIFAIVLAGFSVFYSMKNQPRMAYLEMGKIYEGFKLKKEFETKLKSSENIYAHQLDSVKFLISELYNELKNQKDMDKIKLEKLQQLERVFQHKSQQQEESQQRITADYTEKIWKRINGYVEEYGKSRNYQYIFGANGMGSIMYGNNADNITEEMMAYINSKYEGKVDE